MAVTRTYLQIQDEAITLIGGDTNDVKLRAIIKYLINHAYWDVLSRGPFDFQYDTEAINILTDGTVDYTLTKNAMAIDGIYVIANQSYNPLDKKSIKEFQRVIRDASGTKSDLPHIYFTVGLTDTTRLRKIRIWPPVSTSNLQLTVDMYLLPDLLSADGDVPLMPPDSAPYLIHQPVSRFFHLDEDPRFQIFQALADADLMKVVGRAEEEVDEIMSLKESDLGSLFDGSGLSEHFRVSKAFPITGPGNP